jgi:hypothetical protein
MYFNISEWVQNVIHEPNDDAICPYRVLDPATGSIIAGVREFNDDEGWLRVFCRGPKEITGRENRFYAHPDTDEMVTQILYVPYQVVPYYHGIDDLPNIYIDTMTYDAGRPTGDWLPVDEPYHPPSSERA